MRDPFRRRCLSSFLLAVALLGVASASAQADEAHVITEQRLAPRVVELTISTPAFATPTHVDIDLPTGYDAEPGRRWPVAYFLAGTMNTYASFNHAVDGVGLTQSFPAIVVSPNGDSGYWSDWYNGGSFGAPMYESFVIDQLIPLIDARFRTIPDRSQRAVAGVSMGGYGSMMLAARHPDLFADAASISGADDSNLPDLAAALSVSPTFQGGAVDAIYGPRATQEIRWRGHNPTDLANNLRGLDLQVRTANGIPNPAIGENLLSADSVSCVVEAGVYGGSVDLNRALNELKIPHLWKDYGPGCHTPSNFEREIADTIHVFTEDFAHPSPPPASFDYESMEPEFDVWGWHVGTDPQRALEFLRLESASARGLTLVGSGTTAVTTAPLFPHARWVQVDNATPGVAIPDSAGRLHITVDLGPPDTRQQYTLGPAPAETRRTVTLTPHYSPPPKRGHADGARGTGCTVPKLKGATLQGARRRLRRAGCGLGKVHGEHQRASRVVGQHPRPGRQVPAGARVAVKLG